MSVNVSDSAALEHATDRYNSTMERLNSGEELSEQELIKIQEDLNYYKLLMETLTSMVQAKGEAEMSAPKKL
jgi:hypothetical protein